MEANQHSEDLRNVQEGDTIEITTSEGETFEAECHDYIVERADTRTGEVRVTRMWCLSAVEYRPVVSIVDGLRSSEDDPEFPVHKEIWDQQQEGTMGYITDLTIHGEMEA